MSGITSRSRIVRGKRANWTWVGRLAIVASVICCLPGRVVAIDPVHTTATLSEPRSNLGAAPAGGKAIFAGGYDSGGYYNDAVDIYHADSNTWTTATLSVGRGIMAAAAVGGKAFFAGGRAGNIYRTTVDVYTGDLNTWTTASLSEARANFAGTSAGGKALFAGGYGDGYRADVDIYDADSNTWTTASLSQARCNLAATSVGGKALFAGGYFDIDEDSSKRQHYAVVDIYHADSNTWTTASLSQARSSLAAAAVGNKAFFAGGYDGAGGWNGSGFSDVVDIYDADSNTWTTATLSQARRSLAATAAGNMVFFAGGFNADGESNVVDIYNVDSNTWTTTTLSQARCSLAATAVGEMAIFAGGYLIGTETYSNVVDIYIPEPATLVLLGAAVPLVLKRGRKVRAEIPTSSGLRRRSRRR